MHIVIKRIYDEPDDDDGTRVLVDRLWPRGVSKREAKLDEWARHLAPSPALRKWFGHDPDRFQEFARRYKRELAQNQQAIDDLLTRIDRRKRLTLLYSATDPHFNQAVVLKKYLVKR